MALRFFLSVILSLLLWEFQPENDLFFFIFSFFFFFFFFSKKKKEEKEEYFKLLLSRNFRYLLADGDGSLGWKVEVARNLESLMVPWPSSCLLLSCLSVMLKLEKV